MYCLKPYAGATTKLILGFDVGTTYSKVSYCILEPGRVPEILGVRREHRFPCQELARDDAAIPSLLYYDKNGVFKTAGAEVLRESVTETALEEGWTKAERWKLYLRPKHFASSIRPDDELPPLPVGKSAVNILTDFIEYLSQCAKEYIQNLHVLAWSRIKDSIEYVFTLPNGWEGIQHQLYRRAIEEAGLVPSTPEGRSRVHTLSEGEAILHFCVPNLDHVWSADRSAPEGAVVIDAGDRTIDLSMFSMTANPISCEEIAPAECRLQGSMFVTRRAKVLLQRKLQGWEHSSSEISEFTREFDQSTKLVIKTDQEPAYVRVAGRRYMNSKYGISAGRLRLTGEEATGLFNDSVDAIISAFKQQEKHATIPITAAFLVGGLSANDWLWSRVQSYFQSKNIKACRPDSYINWAIPSGAVLSHVDRDNHRVASQVARATYGVVCALPVNENDKQHIDRKPLWEKDPVGNYYVPGYFDSKLRKGEQVTKETQFRETFSLTKSDPQDFGMQTLRLVYHRGTKSVPTWVDQDRASFFIFCTVRVNLSKASKDSVKRTTFGQVYYRLDYVIIVYFGFTELKAELCWKTKRGEQRVPATISFEEDDITPVKEPKKPVKALSPLLFSGDMLGEERKRPRRAYWQAVSNTSKESSTSDPGSPSAPSSPVDPQGVSFNDDKDRMIAGLTAKIKQWKQADSAKSEELGAVHRNVEQLHMDIALEKRRAVESARELFEEQKKMQQLTRELGSLRSQFQTLSSSVEEKDGMIATHIAEIKQLKLGGAAQAEELTTTCNALERLRRESITNQECHVAQSVELTAQVEEWKQSDAAKAEKLNAAYRDLEQLRADLSTSVAQIADAQRRHATESTEFTSQVEELKRSNSTKAQDLAAIREKVASLENHLSTSSSRIIELEQQDKNRTVELSSLREQYEAALSYGKERDRTVASLTAEIEHWELVDITSSSRITELEQRNGTLSMELVSVKDQLKNTDRIIASLTADVDRWKCADAQKAEQLSIAHEQVQKLKKDLSTSTAKLVDLEDRYEAQSCELVFTHKQLQECGSRADDIHKHYDEQLRVLKITTAEHQPQLFEAQRFVALADEYATWTITQILQHINIDIQSSISLVTSYFSRDFQPAEEPSEEHTSAAQKIAKMIGQTLVDRLGRSKSRDDVALCLAIAFRAYLVHRVHWVISSWTLDAAWDGIDEVMDEMCRAIQQNETSTVTGRWRSLTRTYILASDVSDLVHSLTSATVEGLSDIAVVAGCARSASAANETWLRFQYSILLIVSAAVRLRKIIEGVVSSDFKATAPRYGQTFDPIGMEVDMMGDGQGQTRKVREALTWGRKVLCATSLGLTKQKVLPGSNEDTSTLVKAQVFLD